MEGCVLDLQRGVSHKLLRYKDINTHLILSSIKIGISPIVLIPVVLMLVLHCPLLRATVNTYSVLEERPVIVHGLVVHSVQPGDGGVQLTEVVMSLGSLGWSHCRVTLHSSTVAATFVGGGSGSRSTRQYNKKED